MTGTSEEHHAPVSLHTIQCALHRRLPVKADLLALAASRSESATCFAHTLRECISIIESFTFVYMYKIGLVVHHNRVRTRDPSCTEIVVRFFGGFDAPRHKACVLCLSAVLRSSNHFTKRSLLDLSWSRRGGSWRCTWTRYARRAILLLCLMLDMATTPLLAI